MVSSNQIERTAAAWLARRDAGTWTEADQIELDTWLGASSAHRVAWLRLNAAWQQTSRLKALGAGLPPGQVPPRAEWATSPFFKQPVAPAASSTAPAPSEVASTHEALPPGSTPVDLHDYVFTRRTPTKPRRSAFRFGIAASLALTAALALSWWQFGTVERASYATVVGDIKTVSLPDGSQATLSSSTHIDMTLTHRERHIAIQQGEAYFDVVKDPSRPFVVQAGERRVVVVGTHFSVRRDADELRVVVSEGRVRLEPGARSSQRPMLLTAGMTAWASQDGLLRIDAHSPDQVEELLSWRDGLLRFRDTPLAQAVAEFNRYNTRKLVIGDPSLASLPVGGNIRLSNVDAFVHLLERGYAIRAEQRGDEIVLNRK